MKGQKNIRYEPCSIILMTFCAVRYGKDLRMCDKMCAPSLDICSAIQVHIKAFCSQDMTIYLLFLVFTSRPISLLLTNKAVCFSP
jgi:hypothetical protein